MFYVLSESPFSGLGSIENRKYFIFPQSISYGIKKFIFNFDFFKISPGILRH